MAAGPLAGVRVIDLTQLFPGPLATCILADLGAEVWKVEPPEGDPVRRVPPLAGGCSVYFHQLNRGKKSVCLNLKDAADRAVLLGLVSAADALVESYRPGVLERLGLDRATLERTRPGLVVVSVSGWGRGAVGAGRAGHDLNYQAAAGALEAAPGAGPGPGPGGAPAMPPALWGDVLGGLVGAVCALSGLLAQRSGAGAPGPWDAAIVDALLYAQQLQVVGGQAAAGRWAALPFGGQMAWYRCYPTADGRWVSVAALEPKFWEALVRAAGHPEWIERQHDPDAQAEMTAGLEAWFRARPYAEWQRLAGELEACVEPVARLDEAVAAARAAGRGLVRPGPGEDPDVLQLGLPAVGPDGPVPAPAAWRPAPRLGEHAAEARALLDRARRAE